MKKYLDVLCGSALFAGLIPEEVERLLGCLNGVERRFKKDEYLLRAGEPARALGILLSGRLRIVRDEYTGERNVVAEIGPADVFAESYACLEERPSEVSVFAASDAAVLFIETRRLLTSCPNTCRWHARLIMNLVALLANKNITLNEKLSHVTQRSTRRKLLSYLSSEALRAGASEFDIPFDRQELADYLAVDRSAMSAELSRMSADGLIRYRRNKFTLLSPKEL